MWPQECVRLPSVSATSSCESSRRAGDSFWNMFDDTVITALHRYVGNAVKQLMLCI